MSDNNMQQPILFGALGIVMLGLAIFWWYQVFGTAVESGHSDYMQASRCIWGNDYVCTLLLSLCTQNHGLTLNPYRPELFWAGSVLLLAGLGIAFYRRLRRVG